MTLPFTRCPLTQALLSAALSLGSLSSLAAGFQLNETSGSGLGRLRWPRTPPRCGPTPPACRA